MALFERKRRPPAAATPKAPPKAPRRRATAKEIAEREKLRAEAELLKAERAYLDHLRTADPPEYARVMRQRLGIKEPKPAEDADPIAQTAANIEKLRAVGLLPRGKAPEGPDPAMQALANLAQVVAPPLMARFGLLPNTGHLYQESQPAAPTAAPPPSADQGAPSPAPSDEGPFIIAVLEGREPAEAAALFRRLASPAVAAQLGAIADPAMLEPLAQRSPSAAGWLRWLGAPARRAWTVAFCAALRQREEASSPTPEEIVRAIELLAPEQAAAWLAQRLPADVLAKLRAIPQGQEEAYLSLAPILQPELGALAAWLTPRLEWTRATLAALRALGSANGQTAAQPAAKG